jgi:rhamnosyltransferase
MVEVSIIVLTKNGRPHLERLLPSVVSQAQKISYELLVVDSGSVDGTLELLRRYPARIVQIPPQDFHHARTRNFAARLAKGQLLVLLSQDAIPASEIWLESMIKNFDDPQVGAVYGRQCPKPGSSWERRQALDAVYGEVRVVKDPAHRNGLGYRFYHFSDANAAIRRDVWEQTQFPEDLKVFEDLGLAKRVLDSGWKIVYEPKAAVMHSHNHNTLGLFKRYFDIGYTLKLLNIWDAPDTRKSLLRDAFRMLKDKFHHPRSDTRARSVRKGLQQDFAKWLGMFLGLNQNCLPLALKRHLSAFRVFE